MLKRMMDYFDSQAELRERALEASRATIRASARSIAATHRGDKKEADAFLAEAKAGLDALAKVAETDAEMAGSSYEFSAQQEYGEARLVKSLITERKLLEPEELGISYRAYLGALGDVAGELRRHILDKIRANEVDQAEAVLKLMETIFEILMEFDYADAVLPGMKRRQDLVRQLLEKTRGDLTVALRQQRLEHALERRDA